MLLILTNSEDETANYLCGRIDDEMGVKSYLRLNTNLREQTKVEFRDDHCFLMNGSEQVPTDEINAVWFRRPKPLVPESSASLAIHTKEERTAALEGALGVIPAPLWVNYPFANASASFKIEQLIRAKSYGLTVPESIVTDRPNVLRAFWEECNREIIVKPLSGGYLESEDGDCEWLIYTNEVSHAHITSAHESLPGCPTLFQRRIQKQFDVRVTIVDHDIWGVRLSSQSDPQSLDIRKNNMQGVEHEQIHLPDQLKRAIQRLVTSYQLRFAALDFVVDDEGTWYFLEVNPNGQWAWQDIMGVTNISSSLMRAFGLTE